MNVRNDIALINKKNCKDRIYLDLFSLEKGNKVYGLKRYSSSFNITRINYLYLDPFESDPRFSVKCICLKKRAFSHIAPKNNEF